MQWMIAEKPYMEKGQHAEHKKNINGVKIAKRRNVQKDLLNTNMCLIFKMIIMVIMMKIIIMIMIVIVNL